MAKSLSSVASPISVSLSKRLRRWTLVAFQLLLIITPFFFTWVNEELFEFNKMMLVYGFTVLILGLWGARMVLAQKFLWRRTFMDLPIAIFLASQLLSTLFSIHPYTSIFGFYTRFNGGLLSILAYLALLYAAVNSLTRKDLKALIVTTLVGGLGIALYAVPEHFGHSPSCYLITNGASFGADCWIQDVQNRIFGTFGQPNWLAAYAVALLPVAAALKIQELMAVAKGEVFSKKYSWFLWAVMLGLTLTLLFTKSRSGLLGLAGSAGIMAAGLFIVNQKRQELSAAVIKKASVMAVGLAAVIAIFGTPFSPSLLDLIPVPASINEEAPAAPAGPALETGGTESGAIRKIVWEGSFNIWKRYPLFGSGVETFAYSYYQDRPVAHNMVSEWDFLYNKAHNELLQYLATTGIVGLASYLVMLAWFKLWVAKQVLDSKSKVSAQDQVMLIGLVAGMTGLSISNFFGFSTVVVNTLLYLFMGWGLVISLPDLATQLKARAGDAAHTVWQKIGLVLVVLVTLWGVWSVCNWWLADYDYARGKRFMGAGETAEGLDSLLSAIARQPYEALFYDELSLTYAQVAVAYERQEDATSAAEFTDAALMASDQTMALNNRHLNFYKNRARILVMLSEIDPTYMNQAQQTLATAVTLAPSDAKLLYNLAVLDAAVGDVDSAIARLQQTISIKGDYQDAYLELARIYESQDRLPEALTQYKTIQNSVAPNDQDLAKIITDLEATIAAQTK